MSNRAEQSHHPQKLKALFSCGIFRNCTQTAVRPTKTAPPTPPETSTLSPPSLPPPPAIKLEGQDVRTSEKPRVIHPSSSSSSSSSTSQSFTQWRFPLSHPPETRPEFDDLHAAEVQLASGNRVPGLRLLERSLAKDPGGTSIVPCPPSIISGVISAVQDPATTRPAAKVLLALLLFEGNRKLAVESGAVAVVLEAIAAVSTVDVVAAERALAALELMCTVAEGAAEARKNSRAAGILAVAAEKMVGRGRECAIGVLAAVYAGEWMAAAPPEVGRAVVAALQGDCTARARRKGSKLLKALKESARLDLPEDAL